MPRCLLGCLLPGLAVLAGPGEDAAGLPSRPWSVLPVRALPNQPPPVAGMGDLQGDGLADVVAGGPLEQDGRGRVLVFMGRAGGLAGEPDWTIDGERPNQHLGTAVALLDVDGDGCSDLVVSDWAGELEGPSGEAAVHVFRTSAGGLPAAPTQTLRARAGQFRLRRRLASAGDVNGDGCADLAVAAVDPSRPLDGGSCIVVLAGSPAGLRPEPVWVFHSEQEGSDFGGWFGTAGDVNGDGCEDFLASAWTFTGRFPSGGRAYLFLGSSPEGLQPRPAWTRDYPLDIEPGRDEEKQQFFGRGLGAAGDVNGDGFDDVLVGAWNASHGDIGEGAVFLYLGSNAGLSADVVWRVEGNHPHAYLGYAVCRAGDLDGDGLDDILIGAPYVSHGQNNEGVVLAYHGSAGGLEARPAWSFDGDRSNGHLGEFVSGAGDVNGDGLPDVLMAGTDSAESLERRLRLVVVYGRRGGLAGSSNWSPDKPPLAALQQRLERLSPARVWSFALGGVVGVVTPLVFALRQVRRKLARTIAENRALAATQERARIARDIHDHLGADLTRLAAQLDRVPDGLDGLPATRLRRSAHQAVTTLDELVWATNPEQDTIEGLAGYLAEFAPGFCEAHGLQCELDLAADLPPSILPARARHNLFLVAKEALRNTARHAGAKHVRLTLTVASRSLHLVIEDDGCGFTPAGEPGSPAGAARHDAVNPAPGNGLANMRARADELAAALVIQRRSPRGTRVAVTLPLSPVAPHSTTTP